MECFKGHGFSHFFEEKTFSDSRGQSHVNCQEKSKYTSCASCDVHVYVIWQ